MDIPLDLKLFMNNAASKVYKCDQCNASYSDKAYFEMHKQSHQKEVLQIVMTSGAGSSSGHPAPAHQQQVIHLQDQNQQLRAFKQAYGSDAQVYQVVDGSYQVSHPRSTAGSSTSSTTISHNTMNHQAQVNVPTYTAPTYIMTEVPVQHNRLQTQQPTQHHQQQQQQQQQHQVQQQVQLQQQVQVQPQIQQHVQHAGPGNPRSLQSQDTKERPYKCDQCTASFIDPAELAEHTKKHSGDGPFTCEDCHFTFMYKSHFRSHKTRCSKKTRTSTRVVNPKPVQRNFPTNQQTQQAGGQASQQTQQYVQAAPAKAPTPKKPKRSQEFNPSAPTFKRTKKETIKADRPFECNECDASFQSLQDLQNHKTKHTGEGPFKCEECRFVFLYRKLYEAHRRRCEKKRKETTRGPGTVSRPAPAPQPTHQTTHHTTEQHHVQQHHQQIQQVQHQVSHHHQQQQLTQRPTTVSTVAQVHNIPHHQPAVIDMRAVQSQLQHQQVQQQVQHLQHPQLIEQVIHVTPSGTIAGGRQDFAAVDMDSMNQIMNLIKVKGHH